MPTASHVCNGGHGCSVPFTDCACPCHFERPERTVTCCGEELECGGFTNTCPSCGADFNWAGQRLAPRAQWGEETGETAAEILLSEAQGFPEMEE